MKRMLSAILLSALCLIGVGTAREIIIKGSDTMLNLVQRMVEEFGTVKPDALISVTGGGSGVGINAVVNGSCDIANASRSIKSKELYDAKSNGVNPVEFAIAIDGLSIIVHPDTKVTELTVDQVGAIFRGEVKNWNELGGANRRITLYGRQPSSGTFVYMRDEVMKGDYAPGMRQMNGNAQVVEAVKTDKSAIGYVGAGYVRGIDGVTVLKVARDAQSDYVSPLDAERVNAGEYPITRPLFQYTNGKPKGTVRDFILFELGEKGQKVVEEEGFFPVTAEYRERNNANLK